ncbi:MAG: gliding motility-associated C-terminal domain-containing protein [Bacteroidetes bacterium]|nr:gliding motility-associated C-terminal domain-containing protein [Bacteroidota bacterium]
MRNPIRVAIVVLFFCRMLPLYSQTPAVVISSYLNAADPRDEWSELLVVADNTNMVNWVFQDNNSTQTQWQPSITFSNPLFWNNMRAGTIIMIWHRMVGSTGIAHPVDITKGDGYIEVSANDPVYFSGGNFGTSPTYGGPTLNIAAAGDVVVLQNSSATFVHGLGHKATPGADWVNLPLPKLNQKTGIANGDAVFVCPGTDLNKYGYTAPQDGTTWTSTGSGAGISFGLPNTNVPYPTENSDFWRSLRQPSWAAPTLTGTVNGSNTQVTLNWNAATDPNPSDGSVGYIILRNTANVFGTPLDGHTYTVGDNIGGATVIAQISSSQTLTCVDNVTVPCTPGFYYRILAYRYSTDDNNGNDYNVARGRAYNETNFGGVQVSAPTPVAPVTAVSDRNNFCADDPGNITLSATGGSGTTLNWYTVSCGGTLLGAGSGPSNSITIPSPAVTTTYYARWENNCGFSACASVTVTVLALSAVSVTISANPGNSVCANTPVTFTAAPVNPGTAPSYQWKVNGANAGTNSAIFTYIPLNGDNVNVVMTSNASCITGNPATSNTIVMTVTAALPVTVTISASPGNTVCTGTPVTFTATPGNPGTSPTYQWKVNGANAGTNSNTYTYIPANGDNVFVILTSNATCASGNPATSNTIIMSVSSAVPVSATVTATPGDSVCAGTTVTYTVHPLNEGTTPSYQWFLNGTATGTNSPTWSNVPVNGDHIFCVVTSSLTCAANNPATSDTVIMTISSALPVSASISASPGDTVCSGTSVTYTATPVNGGSTPAYEWFLNGTFTGGTNQTWSNVPVDGDKVYCRVTSSFSCAANNPALSDTVTISITAAIPVSVSVKTTPGDTVCSGTPVTYKATPVNGGTNPTYEWFYNGTAVGGNSATWTNIPVSGDVIWCRVTSGISCATNNPAISNSIAIVISSGMPVSVTVTATPGDTVCSGTAVTIRATPVNGGTTPIYQWYLNGNPAGNNNPVYSLTPADGDKVYCTMTSSFSCAINNPATSSTITISFTAAVTATITISADHKAICPGTVVTFRATPSNEGSAPVYEWLVNGISVQQGSSPDYTSGTLTGGESVICRLTSSLPCLVSNPVESAALILAAAPVPVVNLSDKPYLCAGETSQLDAGAGFKTYSWQDGSTGRYYSATSEGLYKVTVTDSLDCKASDSVRVQVCESLIYLPDAFTPNGDGLNDEFRVVTDQEGITGFSMLIYNRWGQLVFESSEISKGWNGMMNGKYAETGTYAWKIVYQVSSQGNSSSTTLHGTFMLIR